MKLIPRISYLLDELIIRNPRLRLVLTQVIYGNQNRPIEIFGTRLVVNSTRENGYLRSSHKAKTSSLLRDEIGAIVSLATLLVPGDTFVDVGANIGLFCCTLNRINQLSATPSVKIYAYEPHPDTFQRLVANTKNSAIVVRQAAVSKAKCQVEFVDGAVSHVFTTANLQNRYNLPNRKFMVQTICLDDEPIDGHSIILKIDVEGQELDVLQGARSLFASKRVKAVYLDGYQEVKMVERFLLDHGFSFFEGRSMRPVKKGEFSLLAIQRPETARLQ